MGPPEQTRSVPGLRGQLGGILIGLGLTVFFLTRVHPSVIGHVLGEVGFGIALVVLLHAISVVLDAQGWYRVLRHLRADTRRLLIGWTACVRNAVQTLVPVGASGFVAGYRELHRRNLPAHIILSSLIFETTLVTGTELLLLIGSAVFVFEQDTPAVRHGLVMYVPIAAVLTFVLLLILFFQIRGNVFGILSRGLARLGPEQRRTSLSHLPLRIKHDLNDLYRTFPLLMLNFFWQTTSLLVGAASLWLIFFLIHVTIPFPVAVFFLCLARSARSFGFLIPSAWGLQEGLFMVLAPLAGVSTAVGLAVSLILRVRDFIFAFLIMAVRSFLHRHPPLGAAVPPSFTVSERGTD